MSTRASGRGFADALILPADLGSGTHASKPLSFKEWTASATPFHLQCVCVYGGAWGVDSGCPWKAGISDHAVCDGLQRVVS